MKLYFSSLELNLLEMSLPRHSLRPRGILRRGIIDVLLYFVFGKAKEITAVADSHKLAESLGDFINPEQWLKRMAWTTFLKKFLIFLHDMGSVGHNQTGDIPGCGCRVDIPVKPMTAQIRSPAGMIAVSMGKDDR